MDLAQDDYRVSPRAALLKIIRLYRLIGAILVQRGIVERR